MRPSQIFANAAHAATHVPTHDRGDTAERRDRRTASRPWSQAAATGPTASSILKASGTSDAAPRELVTTASSSDWSEF